MFVRSKRDSRVFIGTGRCFFLSFLFFSVKGEVGLFFNRDCEGEEILVGGEDLK